VDLEYLDGQQARFTWETGLQIKKMEWVNCLLEMETNTLVNLYRIEDKATDIISGKMVGDLKVGGIKTSNTDLESTLVLNSQI
jgi:hypothetical protein